MPNSSLCSVGGEHRQVLLSKGGDGGRVRMCAPPRLMQRLLLLGLTTHTRGVDGSTPSKLSTPLGCDRMVECINASDPDSSSHMRKPHAAAVCPGVPECSGHGRCRGSEDEGVVSCHCSEGFFGRDCSRRMHDCARLRSCSDCQHPANTKFCGWCAGGRYCVPKHVHRDLARRGKACPSWYEDTCPAPRNHTRAGGRMTVSEAELGDDRWTVAHCSLRLRVKRKECEWWWWWWWWWRRRW